MIVYRKLLIIGERMAHNWMITNCKHLVRFIVNINDSHGKPLHIDRHLIIFEPTNNNNLTL